MSWVEVLLGITERTPNNVDEMTIEFSFAALNDGHEGQSSACRRCAPNESTHTNDHHLSLTLENPAFSPFPNSTMILVQLICLNNMLNTENSCCLCELSQIRNAKWLLRASFVCSKGAVSLLATFRYSQGCSFVSDTGVKWIPDQEVVEKHFEKCIQIVKRRLMALNYFSIACGF